MHTHLHNRYSTTMLLLLALAAVGCGAGDLDILEANAPLVGNCTVTLGGSPVPGSVAAGSTVTFTATGSCTTGTPQYLFSAKQPNGYWTTLRTWGSSASFGWDTTSAFSGIWQVMVKVRAVGSSDAWEGYSPKLTYTVTGGSTFCSKVNLSSNPLGSASAGTTVTLSASAVCPSGSAAEYKFMARDPAGTMRTLRNYSTATSSSWDTSGWLDGWSTLYAYTRRVGSPASFEAVTTASYHLSGGASYCSAAALAVSPTGSVSAGTSVSLTATSSCTSGVEYRFVDLDPSGVTRVLRTWGTSASYTWDTTGTLSGGHRLYVQARLVGSSFNFESQSAKTTVTVTGGAVFCTSASLSASPASTAAAGAQVAFSGAASCPSGQTAEYRYVYKGPDGLWRTARTWGASPNFSWDTTLASTGSYTFYFYARVLGGANAYDSFAKLSYTITGGAGYCNLATLSVSPASSSAQGSTVTMTAGSTCTAGETAEYRFYGRQPDNKLALLRDWGAAAFAWDTSAAALGTWSLQVYSRRQGGTLTEGISPKVPYSIATAGGTFEVMSLSTTGAYPNDVSHLDYTVEHAARATLISADGRHAVFRSWATNLDPSYNLTGELFRRDRTTGKTELFSIGTSGATAAACGTITGVTVQAPTISNDGRYVAFHSECWKMIIGGNQRCGEIFLRDMQTGTSTRPSKARSPLDPLTRGWCSHPAMAAGGTYLVFQCSGALISGDGGNNVYRYNYSSDTLEVVSRTAAGAAHNGTYNRDASVSSDGRYVAFASDATNLVSGDSNGVRDVFVKDMQTGAVERVSVTSSGGQAAAKSELAAISADGRYVTFLSQSHDLWGGTAVSLDMAVLHDRQTGATSLVSQTLGGLLPNTEVSEVTMAAAGRVAFTTTATNLVAGKTNSAREIYIKHLASGALTMVQRAGLLPKGWTMNPTFSSNGKYLLFVSTAYNLIPGAAPSTLPLVYRYTVY